MEVKRSVGKKFVSSCNRHVENFVREVGEWKRGMVSCGSGEVWDWREEYIGKAEEAKLVGQWGRINSGSLNS